MHIKWICRISYLMELLGGGFLFPLQSISLSVIERMVGGVMTGKEAEAFKIASGGA